MSLKVNTFVNTNRGPKTIDKFCVVIPGILDSPVRVSSSSLPMESKNNDSLTFAGYTLNFPTTGSFQGTWTCTVEESLSTDVLLQLKAVQFIQSPGLGHNAFKKTNYLRPLICILDQATGTIPQYWVTLKHCYLEKIQEPTLDWSKPDTPIRWTLTFRYSTISKFPLV